MSRLEVNMSRKQDIKKQARSDFYPGLDPKCPYTTIFDGGVYLDEYARLQEEDLAEYLGEQKRIEKENFWIDPMENIVGSIQQIQDFLKEKYDT